MDQQDDAPDDRKLEIAARYKAAREHASQWRKEARECFDYYAGEQWSEEDKQKLQDQLRPVITFNRAAILIDAVLGYETNNRMETRYIPRTLGDAKVNEMLTEAANYFRDQCDAEFEESDGFRDAMICGMGWTGDRLSDDANPEFDLIRERVDPFEMLWDPSAKKPNLADARYMFREKFMARDEVKAALPQWDGQFTPFEWQDDPDEGGPLNADHRMKYHGEGDESSPRRDIPVLEYQYIMRETQHMLATPDGQTIILSSEQYDAKKEEIAANRTPHTAKTQTSYCRIFMVGGTIVKEDRFCPRGFSYHCITGKRDRNRGYWFGLMSALIDPQNWSNKWLSQILHIINSNAKGGLIVEKGAFDNQADFEQKWADPSGVTVVKDGVIQQQRLMPKPPAPYPAGVEKLLEYANTSFTDVSGVNQELLGMADREQPGVLEWQRKQSAVTLLAPLFDSLRRYRKMAGRTWLYLMTQYMSDGRMIRITQDEQDINVPFGQPAGAPQGQMPMQGGQMPPMGQPGAGGPPMAPQMPDWKSQDVTDYDVIVDQSSSSPNLKEATWAVVTTLPPAVIAQLPPQTWITLLEYSPLPESLFEKLKEQLQQMAANPPPNPDQMKVEVQKQQIAMQAQAKQQELQMQTAAQQQQMQLEMAKAQQEMGIKKQQAELEIMIEMQKAQTQQRVAALNAQNQIAVNSLKANAQARAIDAKGQADSAASTVKGKASAQAAIIKAKQKPQPRASTSQ